MSQHRHSRSESLSPSRPPPSPPTQIFHPPGVLASVPTPSLIESVAGGAHYSGVRVESHPELQKHHRRTSSSGGTERRNSESHTEIRPEHEQVFQDLKELYCCRPTPEIFQRSWHKDAIFEDPLSKCKGFAEYSAQWFSMPKLFSKSETLSARVMSSTHTPNRLVYAQKQAYTFRFIGRTKVIDSIVIVDLDESNMIIRLVDQWDGKDLPTRFGTYYLRRLNAVLCPWLVHVPKRHE